MKIGDKVLILDTASEGEYKDGSGPGWARGMDDLVGKKGYVKSIEGGIALVTPRPSVGILSGFLAFDGYWWRRKDLRVIIPGRWRRGKCK